jgi:hypothetical protein
MRWGVESAGFDGVPEEPAEIFPKKENFKIVKRIRI